MMSTLYDYWFVQFDFPDKDGKPYKCNGGSLVWNDKLKQAIPEGWVAVQLKDLLKKNLQAFSGGVAMPTIDLSVMPSGSISLLTLNTSDSFSTNLLEMHEGDLLFGGIRPYLKKGGIAPCGGAVAGTVRSFAPLNDNDYNFALFTLISESMFNFAIQVSTGTRMPTVTSDALLERWVPYNQLISKAFNRINVKDVLINNVNESIKLKALRDWLLPILMNGQATVEAMQPNYRLSHD